MFFIDAALFLLPFLIAILLTTRLPSPKGSLWPIGIAAMTAVALYDLLVLTLPFWGWASEALSGITATAVLVPIVLLMQTGGGRASTPPRPWLLACILPLMVGVLMPWAIRLSYAQRLAWACEGVIVSKYRSQDHKAAALVVQTATTPVTLDGVEEPLWQKARVGEALVKSRGSAFGSLAGLRVRIVPRLLPWRREPGAQ